MYAKFHDFRTIRSKKNKKNFKKNFLFRTFLVLCILRLNLIISRTEHGCEKIYIYSESLAQDLSESEKKSKIRLSYDEIRGFKKDCQHFWFTRYNIKKVCEK